MWRQPIRSASSSSHTCRSTQCYVLKWKMFVENICSMRCRWTCRWGHIFCCTWRYKVFFAELSDGTSTNEPEEDQSFANRAKWKLLQSHQNHLPRLPSGFQNLLTSVSENSLFLKHYFGQNVFPGGKQWNKSGSGAETHSPYVKVISSQFHQAVKVISPNKSSYNPCNQASIIIPTFVIFCSSYNLCNLSPVQRTFVILYGSICLLCKGLRRKNPPASLHCTLRLPNYHPADGEWLSLALDLLYFCLLAKSYFLCT